MSPQLTLQMMSLALPMALALPAWADEAAAVADTASAPVAEVVAAAAEPVAASSAAAAAVAAPASAAAVAEAAASLAADQPAATSDVVVTGLFAIVVVLLTIVSGGVSVAHSTLPHRQPLKHACSPAPCAPRTQLQSGLRVRLLVMDLSKIVKLICSSPICSLCLLQVLYLGLMQALDKKQEMDDQQAIKSKLKTVTASG